MSIYGIFSKPTNNTTIEEAISKRYAERGEFTRASICEEVVAHLAQYDSDDDAMKVIGVSSVRTWKSNLSPKWLKLLAKLRETRKAHVQVAIFLNLVGVAMAAGWSPDMTKIRGNGASEYVRADGKVFDRWTLLWKPQGRGPYQVVASGDAGSMITAFLHARTATKQEKERGNPTRALMLVCPGNWIAAQWKP
ncbi:hypothetical protein EKK58_05215 [Candidatus Dependentiae bacterium]|nr:MAG: hypothetical protein EKK58_05215 [Candidatus Dependentiae bacterium]